MNCGSSLFWDPLEEDDVYIMVGTLESPTGLKPGAHMFVGDAGDYYEIKDDLPKSADESAMYLIE